MQAFLSSTGVVQAYTRSPLEDSRLFGPSPWKILAATNEQNTSEQPSPWRKYSKRESCYGDRVYVWGESLHMHIYIYIHTYTSAHASTYDPSTIYIYIYTYTCIYIYIHIYIYAYIYMYTHTCISLYIYTYICIHIYIYIYIYIHIYICHMHIQAYAWGESRCVQHFKKLCSGDCKWGEDIG